MKTILKFTGNNIGFLVGLVCALFSLVLFSIVESVKMALMDDFGSFGSYFLLIFALTIIYGGMFTFFPSGFGGFILELFIRDRLKKGLLTEKWATICGILLAGLSIMLTCGIGLFVLMVTPHNGWQIFVNEIRNGLFFTNLPYYIDDLIMHVSYLVPEIITAAVLACTSGGFAGKYLAKKINGSQLETVKNIN